MKKVKYVSIVIICIHKRHNSNINVKIMYWTA
jgi:hypothetical protein